MATALDGIRVLDLSQWTAEPYCALVLGSLGADVIKVERPGGEDGRTGQPLVRGVSVYYTLSARNKRGITLNLKDPEGQRILKRLVRRGDVVVESFRPGYLDRLGLGYWDLRRAKRGIVLVSVTGYGHTGPYRDRGSYDMIAQAAGGLMSVNGDPDGPPQKEESDTGRSEEETMAITLNHTIVPAHDKEASAKFFADLFGLTCEPPMGHFAPVKVNDTLTLDFDNQEKFGWHHYAFHVSEEEFDAIFGRIQAAGITYGSDPWTMENGEINHRKGGRGVYWKDPNGHVLELLTVP